MNERHTYQLAPRTIVESFLLTIGENPDRPGLIDTPDRVVKSWEELFGGYREDPKEVFKLFKEPRRIQEMIVVSDIPVHSFCEHHVLPFTGVAHCGYIPTAKIVEGKWETHIAGLSKFARLVDVFARRLQVQERLTEEIAETIQDVLKPVGCGVVVVAEHGCMSCRGVKMTGTKTTTSSLYGCFREHQVRSEFFQFIK